MSTMLILVLGVLGLIASTRAIEVESRDYSHPEMTNARVIDKIADNLRWGLTLKSECNRKAGLQKINITRLALQYIKNNNDTKRVRMKNTMQRIVNSCNTTAIDDENCNAEIIGRRYDSIENVTRKIDNCINDTAKTVFENIDRFCNDIRYELDDFHAMKESALRCGTRTCHVRNGKESDKRYRFARKNLTKFCNRHNSVKKYKSVVKSCIGPNGLNAAAISLMAELRNISKIIDGKVKLVGSKILRQ